VVGNFQKASRQPEGDVRYDANRSKLVQSAKIPQPPLFTPRVMTLSTSQKSVERETGVFCCRLPHFEQPLNLRCWLR